MNNIAIITLTILSGIFALCSGVLCLFAQKARRDALELFMLMKQEHERAPTGSPSA